jgi:hypothetical protein
MTIDAGAALANPSPPGEDGCESPGKYAYETYLQLILLKFCNLSLYGTNGRE